MKRVRSGASRSVEIPVRAFPVTGSAAAPVRLEDALRYLPVSGLTGLAAMPPVRPLSQAVNEKRHLVRPLLSVNRIDLEAYARGQSLSWVEDDSNTDTSYDRNWLRHDVLPILESRAPNVGQRLADSSACWASSRTAFSGRSRSNTAYRADRAAASVPSPLFRT